MIAIDRIRPLLLTAALLAAATTAPLPAQSCASDGGLRRVCALEIRAAAAGETPRAVDPLRPIVIGYGASVDLELRALDQYGEPFPRERLSFGTDLDYGCRDLVAIEATDAPDLLRVRAAERAGSCAVALWIPGNLNLEWPLTIEVAGRSRTGYDLRQAEYVAERLYEGVLGRRPDPSGMTTFAPRIERGDLAGAIEAIVASPEFASLRARTPPRRLLEQIYLGILARPIDPYGERTFLPYAEAGGYVHVVWELVTSEEFERRLASASSGRY